uniref:Large ribosomal subunit protein uL11m n=1 Tax=Coccolithus braarudii TaxID=221442 RepID=A0A7S0PW45_9EUKA|mmetsp:Transcript_18671/g.40254  ORF Transcript_18671/g.40254 Transcript_18671/m.40254 type:complete len:150 (+) Transcript_18671:57-506(+)
MASKLASTFRLIVPAGKATPQPPVGSALGQRGLNLMNFCKAFNDQTASFTQGVPMQVRVSAFADRSFTFTVQRPTTSYFLLKAAGLQKGSSTPGRTNVGRLSVKHIYEIAQVKHQDPFFQKKFKTLEQLCHSLVGSCRSMGIEVYDPRT